MLRWAHLVGKQHNRDGITGTRDRHLCVNVTLPLLNGFKSRLSGHIKHHKGADSLFIVNLESEPLQQLEGAYSCHVTKALLSSNIPQLDTNSGIGCLVDDLECKVNTNLQISEVGLGMTYG